MSLNYSGDLNTLFKFYAKDIAREDGTLDEDKTPAFIFNYNISDSATVNIASYTSGDNNGGILTCSLKNTDTTTYGFVNFVADRIKIGSTEYLRETAIFSNGSDEFITGSSFYEDGGSGLVSGAGSAVYYVEGTSHHYSTIKRIKIIFNSDQTRDVRFYTNPKGELTAPSSKNM